MKNKKNITVFIIFLLGTLSLYSLEKGDTLPPFSVLSLDHQIFMKSDFNPQQQFLIIFDDRSTYDLDWSIKKEIIEVASEKSNFQLLQILDTFEALAKRPYFS